MAKLNNIQFAASARNKVRNGLQKAIQRSNTTLRKSYSPLH